MTKRRDAASSWPNPNLARNAAGKKLRAAQLLGHTLRVKLQRGCTVGTFLIELPTPGVLYALALAGFDFVVLDMEHSAIDFASLAPLLAAAHAAGIAALVRPHGEDTAQIGKILDMGAHGIMAAHVDTPERARAIVDAARFAPHGQRSFSPLMAFDGVPYPLRELGAASYVIVQIEGQAALERVNEIAAVPGVDALFVGPYDLSLSLGIPPGSAKVRSLAQRALRAVPKQVACGIYIDDPAQCGAWAAHGFRLQCVSFDGRMIADAARTVVLQARRALAKG